MTDAVNTPRTFQDEARDEERRAANNQEANDAARTIVLAFARRFVVEMREAIAEGAPEVLLDGQFCELRGLTPRERVITKMNDEEVVELVAETFGECIQYLPEGFERVMGRAAEDAVAIGLGKSPETLAAE